MDVVYKHHLGTQIVLESPGAWHGNLRGMTTKLCGKSPPEPGRMMEAKRRGEGEGECDELW